MSCEMLALDVDGTLVAPDGRIPEEVVSAIRDAHENGVRIVIATGRTFVETIDVWRQLDLAGTVEAMVLIGGALVAEPQTGRTLYSRGIDWDVACEFSDALDRRGYSASAVLDPWRHGLEYLVTRGADFHQVRARWLDKMPPSVTSRILDRLDPAEPGPPPLRITSIIDPTDGPELEAELMQRFGDRLELHVIAAPNYGVTIVEGFAAGVTKWAALRYIAQSYELPAARIAAVGDDVNDLPMIRGAGTGAAMPNAQPVVKDAADVVVNPSLAHFIRSVTSTD